MRLRQLTSTTNSPVLVAASQFGPDLRHPGLVATVVEQGPLRPGSRDLHGLVAPDVDQQLEVLAACADVEALGAHLDPYRALEVASSSGASIASTSRPRSGTA
jgi:hypothetical protein